VEEAAASASAAASVAVYSNSYPPWQNSIHPYYYYYFQVEVVVVVVAAVDLSLGADAFASAFVVVVAVVAVVVDRMVVLGIDYYSLERHRRVVVVHVKQCCCYCYLVAEDQN
jgi:UDP-N-acetylmuramyl pentapeptide phosphotransferase/UDP-N-acetylglucosamine-1-phosphate transferase